MTTKPKRQLKGIVTHEPEQKYKAKVPCGAKTRAGHPCTRPALPGKQRCKLHGGASTGPKVPADQRFNQKAAKHALYSKMLFEHEHDWVHLMRTEEGGQALMTELEMLRVGFLRACVAQKKWLAFRDKLSPGAAELIDRQLQEQGMYEIYELNHHSGVKVLEWAMRNPELSNEIPFDDWKVVKRQKDYAEEMRKFANAINNTVRIQLEVAARTGDEGAVSKLAEDLQAFYGKATATVPGGILGPVTEEAPEQ